MINFSKTENSFKCYFFAIEEFGKCFSRFEVARIFCIFLQIGKMKITIPMTSNSHVKVEKRVNRFQKQGSDLMQCRYL